MPRLALDREFAAVDHQAPPVDASARLSIWRVEAVGPGKMLLLHDLLCDERCRVQASPTSPRVLRNDALLARLDRRDGVSLFLEVDDNPLPPAITDRVVRRALGRLRRRGPVPASRVVRTDFVDYLRRLWDSAAMDVDLSDAVLFGLYNDADDPFVLTRDRFTIAAGRAMAVNACVARMRYVRPVTIPRDAGYVAVRRARCNTYGIVWSIVGLIWITPTLLWIETDSKRRGDTLRRRVEAACGSDVTHASRYYMDSIWGGNRPGNPAPDPPDSFWPEPDGAFLETKAVHYSCWLDRELSFLNGKRPRDCVRTEADRALLELLLLDMEHVDRRGRGPRFDFSKLRRELDLPVAPRWPEVLPLGAVPGSG